MEDKPKLFNLWLTPSERARLEALRQRWGLRSTAEVIRALLLKEEERAR